MAMMQNLIKEVRWEVHVWNFDFNSFKLIIIVNKREIRMKRVKKEKEKDKKEEQKKNGKREEKEV